jgi:hypothetical protein
MRKLIRFIPFLIVVGLLVHHYLVHGRLFDYEDVESHEAIALLMIGLGVGVNL